MGEAVGSILYFMVDSWANGIPGTQSIVGLPIGAFYGYKTDGLFQSVADLNAYPHLSTAVPGDLRIVDVNNDGKLMVMTGLILDHPFPNSFWDLILKLIIKVFDFVL